MKPSNFSIDSSGMSGQLIGTLHKAELEWAAVLVIRYHHMHKLEEWTPVSRSDVATLFSSDTEGAMRWAANPFWRCVGDANREEYVRFAVLVLLVPSLDLVADDPLQDLTDFGWFPKTCKRVVDFLESDRDIVDLFLGGHGLLSFQ
jgi:hypothetical protein